MPLRRSAPSTAASISSPTTGEWATQVRWDRPPSRIDGDSVHVGADASAHSRSSLVVTAIPVVDGVPTLSTDGGDPVTGAVAIRDVGGWWHGRPSVTSTDARLVVGVEQALIDLAALQIRDVAHPERCSIAAGAPWFMTLFGRDSLLTAWMSLPFDASLAPGCPAHAWPSSEVVSTTRSPKRSRARSSTRCATAPAASHSRNGRGTSAAWTRRRCG